MGPYRFWNRPRSLRSSTRISGTTVSTNAKITIDLMIHTPVVSKLCVGEGDHARSAVGSRRSAVAGLICTSTGAPSKSSFALFSAVPRSIEAVPRATLLRMRTVPVIDVSPAVTSASSALFEAEALGVERVQLHDLLRGQEPQRGRMLGNPGGPQARPCHEPQDAVARLQRRGRIGGRREAELSHACRAVAADSSRAGQRSPSPPISSSVRPR